MKSNSQKVEYTKEKSTIPITEALFFLYFREKTYTKNIPNVNIFNRIFEKIDGENQSNNDAINDNFLNLSLSTINNNNSEAHFLSEGIDINNISIDKITKKEDIHSYRNLYFYI